MELSPFYFFLTDHVISSIVKEITQRFSLAEYLIPEFANSYDVPIYNYITNSSIFPNNITYPKFILGHSLGGSIATMVAAKYIENNGNTPINSYTLSSLSPSVFVLFCFFFVIACVCVISIVSL